MSLAELLKLTNTVLEAAIVILTSSVLLYSIQASIRSQVARATNLLLGFTVIAYLGDLFLTQVNTPAEMERWLRAEWVGIAFVPSAYLYLSNALLELNGSQSRWRRTFVWTAFGFSAIALALSALTGLIVRGEVVNLAAPQLQPGLLFPLFALLFGAFVALGASYQFQARRRSRTTTMRRRISYLIATAGGPVISVFPYLAITGQSTLIPTPLFWAVQVLGNSVVGVTIFFMTYSVAYFGVNEPDRVVRLRFIKFLARGPLVAIGVLVALVAVDRAGRFLGLPAERATPFVVVGGIVILQWIILLIKPALERLFYFDERDQVVRIQELRDRVVTTRDLFQFLENILASVCELLQVETAFVASLTADGAPQVELIVGDLTLSGRQLPGEDWQALKIDPDPQSERATRQGQFTWDGYWILPLYDRERRAIVGILGVQIPRNAVENESWNARLGHLTGQAAAALEDQRLQQDIFAVMEGLLQQAAVTRQQQKVAVYKPSAPQPGDLVQREDFTAMVRDAMSHYWGGPKLTSSPLLELQIVRQETQRRQGSSINAMRAVLVRAIESLRPEGKRSMTTAEWILYNILELKFLKRYKVRDIARRLAMSESDLYRKQRIAIEAMARSIAEMELAARQQPEDSRKPAPPQSPPHPRTRGDGLPRNIEKTLKKQLPAVQAKHEQQEKQSQ